MHPRAHLGLLEIKGLKEFKGQSLVSLLHWRPAWVHNDTFINIAWLLFSNSHTTALFHHLSGSSWTARPARSTGSTRKWRDPRKECWARASRFPRRKGWSFFASALLLNWSYLLLCVEIPSFHAFCCVVVVCVTLRLHLQGFKGYKGEKSSQGELGETVRKFYSFLLSLSRTLMIQKCCNSSWTSFVLKGYDGEVGPQGDRGPKGIKVWPWFLWLFTANHVWVSTVTKKQNLSFIYSSLRLFIFAPSGK